MMFTARGLPLRSAVNAVHSTNYLSVKSRCVVSNSIDLPRFSSSVKFTREHEWVSYDTTLSDSVVSVGITKFAQSTLGDTTFVDLPSIGKVVKQGDQLGMVESAKAASDIYSPVSGTVIQVNIDLLEQVSLLNKSPEDKGWLAKIDMQNKDELNAMLTAEEYSKHIGEKIAQSSE